jgi:hypothetical protein
MEYSNKTIINEKISWEQRSKKRKELKRFFSMELQ